MFIVHSCSNDIDGVMVNMLTWSMGVMGLTPGQVQPKTIKLVFAASLQSMQL
jgi:hypothetical protein